MMEKNCEDCKYGSKNRNEVSGCIEYRQSIGISDIYCDSTNRPMWKSILEEHPKPVTIMEAMEWMEKGNKTISPRNYKLHMTIEGRYSDDYEIYLFTIKDFKGEWQLLPPEKKKKDVKEIQDLIKAIKNVIKEFDEGI